MAALTSADITIVVQNTWLEDARRRTRGTLTIAGTNTYPTGGIPLPGPTAFGLVRTLAELQVTGSAGNTTEYVYGYDKTNRKLLVYESAAAGSPPTEADTAQVIGPRTINFHAFDA